MTYIPGGGSGGGGSISTSSDVALNNPANNDALIYDAATQKWINAAGAMGASAYDVAVTNGFIGTETEWLQSLKATIPTVTSQAEADALPVGTTYIYDAGVV